MKTYQITLIFFISLFSILLLSGLPKYSPLSAQSNNHLCNQGENCPVNQPLFERVNRYSVTIPVNGDAADIFYPAVSSSSLDSYPIGLLLPGFNVDKYYYDLFARQVASYGFIVVVPNHVISNRGKSELFAQVQQVTEVLAFMQNENINLNSPIFNHVDGEKLVLLGHSHGGFIGFDAIRNVCESPWCVGNYQRPKELLAGVFYGADFWEDGDFLTIDNSQNPATMSNQHKLNQSPSYPGIPLALIAGSRDSLIKAENVQVTYNHIKQPPKAYIKISGANHYGITNIDNPPGSPKERNYPTLGQPESIEAIARWSALFLRGYALNDAEALDYIHVQGKSQEPNITVISQPYQP
jgi:dienelactone hydrolase